MNLSEINFFFSVIFWASLSSMVYTYFGYPLLITIFASFKSKPTIEKGSLPFVTLVIAAYNEETVIEKKITNSLEIDYPKDRYQILIVTDGSSDNTPEIVKKYKTFGVDLYHQPERQGKMAAINRVVPHSKGEIIVFSDANNFYQSDTIKKLVTHFSDPSVGAVSGAKVINKGDGTLGESEGLYWKYESYIKKTESILSSCTSAAGEILAIRKENFVAPPAHIINDDFFIAMQVIRQGLRFAYEPDAKSSERVSPTIQDEITRRTRINAGRFQIIAMASQILPFDQPLIVWQVVSHKFLRPLIPFFMIGTVISNIGAVFFRPSNASVFNLGEPVGDIMLSIQMLFYTLAITGMRFTAQLEHTRFARLLYIPTFLLNSNWAALKGFIQYIRGKQSHIWERIQRR